MTPILRATHGDAWRAALANQRETNARCMAALRAMIERAKKPAPVERVAAKPAPAFDAALELLIVAAWKGRDVTLERAAVHRLFCARLDADSEMAEGLEITLGVVREAVQRG